MPDAVHVTLTVFRYCVNCCKILFTGPYFLSLWMMSVLWCADESDYDAYMLLTLDRLMNVNLRAVFSVSQVLTFLDFW